MTGRSTRAERKRARRAIRAARAAETEARRLARSLSESPRRRRLAAAIESAEASRRLARKEVGRHPNVSARRAARAAERLQRSTRGLVPGDGGPGRRDGRGRRGRTAGSGSASAAAAAKARAKTLRARRKQAEQVRGWSRRIGTMVLAQAVLAPGGDGPKGSRSAAGRSSRNREAPPDRRP
ncbi:hypothetical protein ACWKWP_04955 [Agromyces soli]